MKMPWRRIIFFAMLIFLVPFMIVYSTNKNNHVPKVETSPSPQVSKGTAVTETPAATQTQTNPRTGPLVYVTGHNKEVYTLLFYPDRQSRALIPVAKRITGYEPSLEEALAALLNKNYAPPGLNKSAFRSGTRLLSVGVNGKNAVIDFNEGLLSDKTDPAAAQLIINTIRNVARQFPLENIELRVNGKRTDAFSKTGLAENPFPVVNRSTESYTVYRPLVTDGLVYIYPETIKDTPVPAKVVNEFLDSLSSDLTDSRKIYISPEVKLLSASLQNGQVTVNFNGALQVHFDEFAKQFSNRQMAENFFFDAIILSVTEIPGVQEVKFLVEGKQINSLSNPSEGNFVFNRPKNINPVN